MDNFTKTHITCHNAVALLAVLLPAFFTATEYDTFRPFYHLPTLDTLRKHGYAFPVYAEEKWVQDSDGYPVKVYRYYYKAM